MSYSRQIAASEALHGATDLRLSAGLKAYEPVQIFDLAEDFGVPVRFVDISMEGLYIRKATPEIWLSALRPFGRRRFTCAHELGHHYFKHSSTIDEVLEKGSSRWKEEQEFVADTFAGFLMMPTLGIRRALNRRKWTASSLTPVQTYTIAAYFGVGYETLVNHLRYSEQMISGVQAEALLRLSPKEIRTELIGVEDNDSLVIIDEHWEASTLDCEVSTRICVERDVRVDSAHSNLLRVERPGLLQATRPGIARLISQDRDWAIFVRICPKAYVGLARFRHMDPEDE